jgi:predicted nucleotidyltransferase component of viral defense system
MAHRSTKVTNIGVSVQARLKNLASQSGQPFAELLLLYTLEGFLRRLVSSPYHGQLVLKGGFLLFGMRASLGRTTRDLDLMAREQPVNLTAVAALVRDLCMQVLPEEDGLQFDPESVETEIILEENDHQGVRAKLYGYLDRSRSRVIIDIATSDPIIPGPREFSFPTLLNKDRLFLQAYSIESIIAEKLHALVQRGLRTSRLKDCYDLWSLSAEYSFDGIILQQAIQATFAVRGIVFTPELPIILTPAFAENEQKQQQWAAFRAEKNAAAAPASLSDALAPAIAFLKPIWEASAAGQPFSGTWDYAAGIWRDAPEEQSLQEEPAVPAQPTPDDQPTQ